MVAKGPYLIIGDILSRAMMIKRLMKNIDEGALLLMDCTGLLSRTLDSFKLVVPDQKLHLSSLKDSKIVFLEAILSQIYIPSHGKLHLREALAKISSEELSISILMEKLSSSSNPFIHSPLDLISIEELIFELHDFSEIDHCLSLSGNPLLSLIEEKGFLIIDLSKLYSTKARKLLGILILVELYSNENPFSELNVFIEGPEGSSLIGGMGNHHSKEFYFELLDRLILNDVTAYFTANHGELDPKFLSRFKTVYVIKHDGVIYFQGEEILNYDFKANFMKLKLEDESLLMMDKVSKSIKDLSRKSILEMLYGNLSDLIADLILSMENNMISRKEFKNLALSLGFFKDPDELLDKLISEDLIEEKIISGIKKLTPSSKGLFLAKSHKFK